MAKINLQRETNELKTQLAYSKNLGFFFGAGTSCALGVPNIETLTNLVGAKLITPHKENYEKIKAEIGSIETGGTVNIEHILNQARRIRGITAESSSKNYAGVTGADAKLLDIKICKAIYNIILEKELVANITNTKRFFAWLSVLNNDYSKEIFTTNYDLIIEKSLEATSIPYFDGFVGSYEPFFWQESIDKLVSKNDLTQNWVRLWKLHGSLSWFWKEDSISKFKKITRVGKIVNIDDEEGELVIYPSREKYESSKKQPFVSYFDRLKKYLLSGELLFIFSGYSFSDQHINEIIFNCLRQNSRLTVLVFFHSDTEVEKLHEIAPSYMNLRVFGPTKAVINGNLGEWGYSAEGVKETEKIESYWDSTKKQFKLGDFNELVNFLIVNSGKQSAIENIIQ